MTMPPVPAEFKGNVTLGMTMPHQDHLFDHIRQNAPYAKQMFGGVKGAAAGKTLAICGAGPSLWEYLKNPPNPQPDQVWGCNSAVPFLKERKARLTHAIGIDQGEGMLRDWERTYGDLTYLIASSVHPSLVKHLRQRNLRIRWFHNFLGLEDPPDYVPVDICAQCQHVKAGAHVGHEFTPITYEMSLYQTLYGPSCMPGFGMNVVSRAIGLAMYVGYDRILVYGSDCAAQPNGPPMPHGEGSEEEYAHWMKQLVVYADGRTAFDVYGPSGIMIEASGPDFHGQRWHTRGDMLITARHIVQIVRESQDRVFLMGNTLPKVLLGWTEDMWTRANGRQGVPDMTGKGSVTGFHLNTPEFIASTILPQDPVAVLTNP